VQSVNIFCDNKVAMFYNVDPLCLLNWITGYIQVAEGRKYFFRGLHVGQPWCEVSANCLDIFWSNLHHTCELLCHV